MYKIPLNICIVILNCSAVSKKKDGDIASPFSKTHNKGECFYAFFPVVIEEHTQQ